MSKRIVSATGKAAPSSKPKKPQSAVQGSVIQEVVVHKQSLNKMSERNTRLIALLDTFEEGDAEEQRRDLAALQIGIDTARPGQRSIFGEGFNP